MNNTNTATTMGGYQFFDDENNIVYKAIIVYPEHLIGFSSGASYFTHEGKFVVSFSYNKDGK